MFLGLLKELQDGLEADGLTEELEVLNTSLSESIRSAILGKHTHSPVLSGSLNHILSKVGYVILLWFKLCSLVALDCRARFCSLPARTSMCSEDYFSWSQSVCV